MQPPASPPDALSTAERAGTARVRVAAARQEPSVHEPPGRPWELELLLSGGVVFALVQLPRVVDRVFNANAYHLSGIWRTVAINAYTISNLILYALIGAFVVHLAGRAYWVGLVGLDAVFPNGVRWEESRYGPIGKKLRQARQPSLQALTDSVDRFCSIIFSFAFATVMGLAAGMVVALAMSLLSVAVAGLLYDGRNFLRVFTAGYVVLMAFMILPPFVDRRWGDRLDPDGWAARLVRASMRFQYAIMLSRAYLPIVDVLSTNLRRRTVAVVSTGVVAALAALFVVKVTQRDAGMQFAYDYLPAAGSPALLEFQHYLNQRPAGQVYPLEPAIQSEMVREPFLRLFLPYAPRRHDALLAERCEGARPREDRPADRPEPEHARREAERAALLTRCLAALQPVTLNGAPLDGLRFHFYVDPRTQQRGLLAHIPTAGLPAGENLLVVGALPVPEVLRDRDDEAPAPHPIPFWIAR